MSDENKSSISRHLTPKELLKTKGISSKVCEEYEQVSRVLPKTGEKLFEPDGSWLENKQIKTNLETSRDLISIERVSRQSALAVAEWIPEEGRAKVIKVSGIDWNSFGHTLQATSYLIPEEALLLLEMNNLDLTCNGISLSIQQAYELLIHCPNSTCTLNEYRVFSQLSRLGYHLQRFYYTKTAADRREEESVQPKKKVIIEPENGKWMVKISEFSSDPELKKEGFWEKIEEDPTIIKQVIENIIDKIEKDVVLDDKSNSSKESQEADVINNENNAKQSSSDKNNDKSVTNKEEKIKERSKPRLEIVSEETILDPVTLIVSSSKSFDNDSDSKGLWPGSRIQRNVKLLPKRTDKIIPSFTLQQPRDNNAEKRNSEPIDSRPCKKSKHEVIELSDDEIEEIPIKMTRMEMLNCFPNIALKDTVSQVIPRNYIPNSIKLQKNIYEYDIEQLKRIRQSLKPKNNSCEESNGDNGNNDEQSSANDYLPPQHNNSSSSSGAMSPYRRSYVNSSPRDNQYYSNDYRQSFIQNGNGNYIYSARFSNSQFYRGGYTSSNVVQQRIMTDCSMNTNFNRQNVLSNRWSSFNVNIFRNVAMATFALRTSSMMQNTTNVYQQVMCNNMFFGRPNMRYPNYPRYPAMQSSYGQSHGSPPTRYPQPRHTKPVKTNSSSDSNSREFYPPSFVKIPADSWTELKQKWKEIKTITIEDDDKLDCSEVEVVEQTIQPLVGIKYSKTLAEVYDRLKIIKRAQEKTVRKKKGDYKISYKVYSNVQHYRKSLPGHPMFHLVITCPEKNFLQPVELNRLQQDGEGIAIVFASVSGAAISFMQAGVVSLPNLHYNK